MRSYANFLMSVLLMLASLGALAQQEAPDALVKRVTAEVLSILREDKAIQSGDSRRAAELIETRVAPHFDFDRMTALAVGRPWGQASEAQRRELTDAFRALLVRTYANALTAYRDQTVSFKPMRKGQGDVLVQSQIVKPGAQPIGLDYRLANTGGEWKVIDVVVANVSLVTNYRGSFGSEVNKGGIEGLLKALQDKNRAAGSAPKGAG